MELVKESKPEPQLPKGIFGKIVLGFAAAIVAAGLFTSIYTVEEHEKAAILTFGKYSGEASAGLNWKLPYPIQRVVKVPALQTQRIHIGYREDKGKITPVQEEALMITGDENIVSADAVVEWKISDIRMYLYNIDDPETFLRNAASAAIRSVIGSTALDYAITEGKTEIQGVVKERLVEMQKKYETGIQVLDVKFQDIEPPEGDVQTAFKDVTNAREEKNSKINAAMKYENDVIPKARGDAQAMIERAEASKKSRILNAQGDVAKFNALFAEYVKNKGITEKRLLLETMEKVMPNARVIITDGAGDSVKYYPINELLRPSAQQKPAGATAGGTNQGGAAK